MHYVFTPVLPAFSRRVRPVGAINPIRMKAIVVPIGQSAFVIVGLVGVLSEFRFRGPIENIGILVMLCDAM